MMDLVNLPDKHKDIIGSVLRIERTSIHDGEGLRTVLFLKGCPLRCAWCSTPESQHAEAEKGYAEGLCTACGLCICFCPEKALSMSEDSERKRVIIDKSKCGHCFLCITKCPQRAWKKYGSTMSAGEAVQEISKDEIFFFHSSGGVTISGGEPLAQADFASEVLKECRMRGIPTAMETSLYAPWDRVEKVLPWLNLLFVDIKLMDAKLHQKWTGCDNALILDNIKKVDVSPYPVDMIVRIPLISGVNDADENLTGTGKFCRQLKKVKEIELLPYHRLGLETYRNLGKEYALKDILPMSHAVLLERAQFLTGQATGIPVKASGQRVGES